mgnify:CR=1 FL=1
MSSEMSGNFDSEDRSHAAFQTVLIKRHLDDAREVRPFSESSDNEDMSALIEQFYAATVERNDTISLDAWGFAEDGELEAKQERMLNAVGKLVDAVMLGWTPDQNTSYYPHTKLFSHMMFIMQLLEKQATSDFNENYTPAHNDYSEKTLQSVLGRMISKALVHERDPRDVIMRRFNEHFNIDDIETGILETRLAADERLRERMSKNN